LRELHAANNHIRELSVLADMESLVTLNLRGNQIENIPFNSSKLVNLQSLDISDNKIFMFGGIESLQSLKEFFAG
jgi:Leucine-rich repeat (LRR) protein